MGEKFRYVRINGECYETPEEYCALVHAIVLVAEAIKGKKIAVHKEEVE